MHRVSHFSQRTTDIRGQYVAGGRWASMPGGWRLLWESRVAVVGVLNAQWIIQAQILSEISVQGNIWYSTGNRILTSDIPMCFAAWASEAKLIGSNTNVLMYLNTHACIQIHKTYCCPHICRTFTHFNFHILSYIFLFVTILMIYFDDARVKGNDLSPPCLR